MSKRIRSGDYPSRYRAPVVIPARLEQPEHLEKIALLTLSEQGSIVAANEQAATLLGRPSEEMVGLQFGDFAAHAAADAGELEVLAWRSGRLEPIPVAVERAASELGNSHVTLTLRPLPERQPVATLALSEALGLAIADANPFLPRHSFELCVSRWPDVRVAASLRQVAGGWISFLAEVAAGDSANLHLEARLDEEAEKLQLWLRLEPRRQRRLRLLRARRQRQHDQAIGERARRLSAESGAVLSGSPERLRVCLQLPVVATTVHAAVN